MLTRQMLTGQMLTRYLITGQMLTTLFEMHDAIAAENSAAQSQKIC